MANASSPYQFEVPWRPNFEARMAVVWTVGAVSIFLLTTVAPIFRGFGVVLGIGCVAGAAVRSFQAYRRNVEDRRLKFFGKEFIDLEALRCKSRQAIASKSYWLGRGFPWTDIEATKLHTLMSMGVVRTLGTAAQHSEGSYWVHGLAPEKDIYSELENLVGHSLIVGSTRVGKTRLFDILIAQAIFRGETVIIIDPKGDHGLAQNARAACDASGEGDRFVYFHPAHPDRSACIDPLRNWNRKTELASRVAALIPSETGADPFTAFGWKVLNDITNGMIATGHRPNLVQLRRYVEGGPESLLQRALKVHFVAHVRDWETRASSYIRKNKDRLLQAYVAFYQEVAIHEAQSVDLDGLISTYEHNRDHFQKMVASLIPILSMLTSDPLQELLSPDFEPGHQRLVTDMSKIIRGNKVVYIGLDSLADSTVGSAIGSIMLADLAAVAGDRYNYGIDSLTPVNLFIDEAAEVLNQPAIQLMNKGGGAEFRVTIATQTFADFASRLGDENKARQVLANTNNKIALRVLDSETQKYIAEGMPPIKVRSMMLRYGHNVDTHIHDGYTASYQEQILEEEAELFPAAMLGELPPLHFIARLSGGRTLKGRVPILLAEGLMANKKADTGWSTIIAISAFILIVAIWVFIPPGVIRSAWIAERAEVYAMAGKGESAVYGRTFDDLQKSLAGDFRGYIRDAEAIGQGPLGNVGFSRWTQDRIMATWLWIGLIAYRLQVLTGWLLPGIPLMLAAYLDGHFVREIRKYSFVAQSPIRHKLGVRVMWMVLAGLAGWIVVPVPMPSLLAPMLIVSISYSLWLWVSNLQKRL